MRTIILVGIGLAIGYWLNTIANEQSNKKLIEQFKIELELLKASLSGKRLSSSETVIAGEREIQLESNIRLLESL